MHEHSSTPVFLDPEGKSIAHKRLVLVGQPNVGKSVIFNAFTGHYVSVSNYPGTTVEVARGIGKIAGVAIEIVDSPGIHSLAVTSDEERVTRALLFTQPDVLVQVCDMKNLRGALGLTLELLELKTPMVLCLNMKDEAQNRGCRVDTQRLSKILGIPVVETTATTREGLKDLERAVTAAQISSWECDYPPEIKSALKNLETQLPQELQTLKTLILQNHIAPHELAQLSATIDKELEKKIEKIRTKFIRSVTAILAEARQREATVLTADVFSQPLESHATKWTRLKERLGQLSLRPWPGYLVALLVLWLLYQFVGVLGAQIAVDFLEETLFNHWINPVVTKIVNFSIPIPFLSEMLVGKYGVFTMALTYAFALILPIVTTFFLAFGILEDTGYLPRLSVLLDKFFKLIGLNGKAVFPMILGLGCGSMAMLTTRILDTKKEKFLVSLLISLAIPCSAQLGVVLGMLAGLHPIALGVWFFVISGSLLSVGWIASKVVPGAPSLFLLEIPPLRLPQISNLFNKVAIRLKWYLREVVPLFVYATIGLYILDALGWLKVIENFTAPVVRGLLGLPQESAEAFLLGFLRRDYGAAGFYHLQRDGLLTLRQSIVAITAITLFMPCVAQVLMTIRERGIKAASAITVFVIIYALCVSGALNYILLSLGWI